jgi:hypothetical protein
MFFLRPLAALQFDNENLMSGKHKVEVKRRKVNGQW